MSEQIVAHEYPSKPIRIVTSEFGSATDLTARLLAADMTGTLDRQSVVDNRGFAAIEVVAEANRDGYTVLCYGPPLWLAPIPLSHPRDCPGTRRRCRWRFSSLPARRKRSSLR
jgi:tripartite-type tricarboxylate transporter receptor subunit TctC